MPENLADRIARLSKQRQDAERKAKLAPLFDFVNRVDGVPSGIILEGRDVVLARVCELVLELYGE